jgi:phage I-like protein
MRLQELDGNFGSFSLIAFTANQEPAEWVLGLSVGEWYNARHGEVPITLDDIETMYRNFKTGQFPPSPQQLPVDYEHLSVKPDRRPGDGIAAAWILDVDRRNNGTELWLKLDYTEPAKARIKRKEYKGFSPLFHPNYTTHGKKQIGPTLIGGALTNYQTVPGCVLTCSNEDTLAIRRRHSNSPQRGPTMKLKNDKGEDVEIPTESLAGLTLDNLISIPAVKDLQAKIPAAGTKIVNAAEFDALDTTVKTLSTTVETLKTDNASMKTERDSAQAKLLDQEIAALEGQGRILPAEKDTFKKLANSNRALYDEMVTARKAAAPLIKLEQQHGGDGHSGNTGSAVMRFDALVTEKRSKDAKLTYADAIKLAAREQPSLAKERNDELALGIGSGGTPMIIASA